MLGFIVLLMQLVPLRVAQRCSGAGSALLCFHICAISSMSTALVTLQFPMIHSSTSLGFCTCHLLLISGAVPCWGACLTCPSSPPWRLRHRRFLLCPSVQHTPPPHCFPSVSPESIAHALDSPSLIEHLTENGAQGAFGK
jgi:hypothetical protein